MSGADTAGHRFSPTSIDGVCRIALLLSPGLCCYGACIDTASHAVVLDGRSGPVEHRHCPTHLAWRQDRQAAAIVSVRELASS